MSTLLGGQHNETLQSENDLAHYFEAHAKPANALKIGLEVELLGVQKKTGKALLYEGASGIHEILRTLAKEFHYEPVRDQENIIALTRGETIVGLEPGGQLELSAPPVSDIFEMETQVQTFRRELQSLEKKFPEIAWLAYGIQPFSALDEISWVPKKRYQVLAEYLKTRGRLSHHMMKRTATNQLNFDYLNEADAMSKLRTALGITSIASAMFANASFSEGAPNGYASYRLEIWNHTAPDRAGLLTDFLKPGKKFSDYLEYILQMPMIFIVRDDQWIPLNGLPFRDFIKQGYQGHRATLGDFELHLSTAFPEARFKQYLEIRGIDGQSLPLIPAVAAFWKGILYDAEARAKAWELVAFASPEEHQQLHLHVPREGLKAKLAGRPILPIAAALVELAAGKNKKESIFLERLQEKILRPGKSPGETLAEKWNGELKHDPQNLLRYLGI